jgi:U3 small nucleolar RNA-associated protein 14
VTLKSTDLLSPPPLSPHINRSPLSGPPTEEPNPWLAHASKSGTKVSKKVNEVVVSKDSKAMDKSKNKLKKLALKKRDEQERAKDDAVVEISLDTVLTSSSTTLPSSSKTPLPTQNSSLANGKGANINPALDEDDSDDSEANLEIDAQEQALDLKGKRKANGIKPFQQRDLVALAFAGDNVVSVCPTLPDILQKVADPLAEFRGGKTSRNRVRCSARS